MCIAHGFRAVRKQSTASAKSPTPLTPSSAAGTPSAGSKSDVRTAKSDGISINKMLGDVTREKCLELIYDALAFDSGAREWPLPLLTITY